MRSTRRLFRWLNQNPLVAGRATRERRVRSVFKGSATKSEIRELVSDYHVTHVLVRGQAKGGLQKYLKRRKSVAVGSRYRIYAVRHD